MPSPECTSSLERSIPILLMLFAAPIVILNQDAAGEGSEKICFFVYGGVGPAGNPFMSALMVDPVFAYSAEPVGSMHTLEEKRRRDRLYFPRTRRDLVEGYDMMILVDARLGHLTTERLADLD